MSSIVITTTTTTTTTAAPGGENRPKGCRRSAREQRLVWKSCGATVLYVCRYALRLNALIVHAFIIWLVFVVLIVLL